MSLADFSFFWRCILIKLTLLYFDHALLLNLCRVDYQQICFQVLATWVSFLRTLQFIFIYNITIGKYISANRPVRCTGHLSSLKFKFKHIEGGKYF